MAKHKVRLDQLLVQRGLAETRGKAQALILAGAVRVGGAQRTKAGEQIAEDAAVELIEALPYASRGGYKLAHALDSFALDPAGLIALDAGASTGGFTDVLLQRGAAEVVAVDVGYGLLDLRLRDDPRVRVLDRTNVRTLDQERAGGAADLVVADLSFISLTTVMPVLAGLAAAGADFVLLVKPQFEAGRAAVGRGGVVRDPAARAAAVRAVAAAAADHGLGVAGLCPSARPGPAGNVEFFLHLRSGGGAIDEAALAAVVAEGAALPGAAR